MLQTLALVDGDLVLGADSFVLLSGPSKIKQDLYLALTERYGADPYHPLWGTILAQYVGQPMTAGVQQSVYNEVNRVLSNYIAVQADRLSAAVTEDTKSTMTTADVVSSIESITPTPVGDSLQVTVALTTMAGQQVVVQSQSGT
jgi:phage baseplate assembly protein W